MEPLPREISGNFRKKTALIGNEKITDPLAQAGGDSDCRDDESHKGEASDEQTFGRKKGFFRLHG